MNQNHRNSTPESRASSSGKSIASRNSSTDHTSTHNLTPTDWDSKSLSPSQTYHTSSLHTEPCVPNYSIFPEFVSSIHRHGKDSPSLGYISEFEALSPTALPAGSHHIDLLNIPGNIPNSIEISAEEPSSKDIPVIETDTQSNAGHGPYAADSHLRNQSGTVSRPRSDVSKVPVILDDNQEIAAAYQSTALKQSSCPILKSQTQPASYSQVYRDHSTYFAPGVKHSETKHMDEKSRTSSVFQQAKDAFFKIGPSLSKVNANNLSGFLVDFMRTYHQDIPLNKLFHLLFLGNYADPESVLTTASTGTGSSDLTESKLIAIQICRFILKKLQAPPNSKKSGAASDQSSVSPPINFHELARSFLAIKIIFSSVKKYKDPF
ncbi:hypothetical protein JCM33374_g1306 [Metschnikowia sp. JCM 33374]|nr:hypothetical protein JCM33374_g1306 [Metschnikowia sp. JCM 33374]